jgi:hypothetical protein
VEVRADAAGRKLDTQVDVMIPTVEKVGVPAKLGTMREIAALTSGVSGGPANLAQIISNISLLPERKPDERRFRLWCDPWWCGALVGLFAVYWAGRKAAGLT